MWANAADCLTFKLDNRVKAQPQNRVEVCAASTLYKHGRLPREDGTVALADPFMPSSAEADLGGIEAIGPQVCMSNDL
jgi:hypothetical protein